MGVLNQLNSYLQGHLKHFKVLLEFVHRKLPVVTVSLKNPTFVWVGGTTGPGQAT